MEIMNFQTVSIKNIPGVANSSNEAEAGGFSDVFSKILGIADMETETLDIEVADMELPLLETKEDTEDNLLYSLFSPHMMILMNNNETNLNPVIQEPSEGIVGIDDKVMDLNLDISIKDNTEIVDNINSILESEVIVKDTSGEKGLRPNKDSSFKEVLLESKSISTEEKVFHDKNIVFLEEDIRIPDDSLIEQDKIKTDDKVSFKVDDLVSKGDKLNISNEEDMDLYKMQIQRPFTNKIQGSRLESAVEHSNDINFDTNIKNINDAIMELMDVKVTTEENTMRVKLSPEGLGHVDITLKMEEGKLVAKILVENEQVKELFNKHMDQLNNKLINQDIKVEKVQIDLNLNTGSHSNFDGGQNHHRNPFRKGSSTRMISPIKAINESVESIHKENGLDILA